MTEKRLHNKVWVEKNPYTVYKQVRKAYRTMNYVLENNLHPIRFSVFDFEQCGELGGRGGGEGRMVIIDQTGVCVCV